MSANLERIGAFCKLLSTCACAVLCLYGTPASQAAIKVSTSASQVTINAAEPFCSRRVWFLWCVAAVPELKESRLILARFKSAYRAGLEALFGFHQAGEP